ncbi:extracellular solute-binding protein [Mucilaginibacter sp.]|uniref:extracellular solute-binding protein n=1 Tax=Mucilaginibacter sp. TaxID=1882438 RepID=UPI0031B5FAC8
MANINTIKIAVRKFGPFENALQKLWDSYCADFGCELIAEMVPMDLDDLHEAILGKQGLKNGDWDIAHLVTDWLLEAWSSGAVEDVRPYIAQKAPEDFPDGWSASLLEMQQFGASIVGLPFHDGPECLIYRKDLFDDQEEQQKYQEQFGKPLAAPQTWDDFKNIARFFYRPDDNLYGTVFAGLPDGHNTVFDFCLQLWTRGGELTDKNGKVNIDTTAAVDGLNFYRDMLRDKTVIHPDTMQYESVKAGMAFARGEAAMMINWFGFASMCEVISESKVKGMVDIAHIPCIEGNKTASLNVYWLYTIGSGSQHKDIAYDFIRYAINKKNDRLLTMEGGIGCRVSTWTDNEVNTLIPYYNKLEQLHQNARSLPQKTNWEKIATVIDEVVLQAINTNIPTEQLLAAAQQKINTIDKVTPNYADTL